jgi:hypothetical protein
VPGRDMKAEWRGATNESDPASQYRHHGMEDYRQERRDGTSYRDREPLRSRPRRRRKRPPDSGAPGHFGTAPAPAGLDCRLPGSPVLRDHPDCRPGPDPCEQGLRARQLERLGGELAPDKVPSGIGHEAVHRRSHPQDDRVGAGGPGCHHRPISSRLSRAGREHHHRAAPPGARVGHPPSPRRHSRLLRARRPGPTYAQGVPGVVRDRSPGAPAG